MKTPVIFIAEHDTAVCRALEADLRERYLDDYRFLFADRGEEAAERIQALERAGESVALLFAGQHLPGTVDGITLLLVARNHFPEAGRILITSHENSEEAIQSINAVGISHYLVSPWQPAAEKLYPIVDDLLADWLMDVRLPYLQVKRIMNPHAARIRLNSNLHHAAEIVALSGIGDLMVVDGEANFVGVLSEGDILRNALPDFDEIVEEGGTLYDAFQSFIRRGQELSDQPIMPLVIRSPLALHPDDHVAKAAKVLIDRQIRRLPVVENGRLVGTVSRANICQAVVGKI